MKVKINKTTSRNEITFCIQQNEHPQLRKTEIPHVGKQVEETESLCATGQTIAGHGLSGNNIEFSQHLNIASLTHSFPGHILKGRELFL